MVNNEGSHIGLMRTKEALEMAKEAELDLVMINANLTPPLCKIINYGKMKYDEAKAEKENRKHQQELKSLRLRPAIAKHDIDTLLTHAKKFLLNGDKVKVICQFRQRELAHPELGKQKLIIFATALEDFAIVDREPFLEGRIMSMFLLPKPGIKKAE